MDDGVYTARWRDVVRPGLFGRRPDRRDLPYRLIIRAALVVFRAFGFRFELRGSANLPPTGGVLLCSNHVSYFDFTFLGLGALPRHRLVRFMAKSSVFDHWFAGPLMRAMKHIPVDRAAGTAAFETSVQALREGQVVGIFPEATISRSFTVKNLKAGVARMAIDAQVPIVPAAVWGGQRVATKVYCPGLPSHPQHELACRQMTGFVDDGEPRQPGTGHRSDGVAGAGEDGVDAVRANLPRTGRYLIVLDTTRGGGGEFRLALGVR